MDEWRASAAVFFKLLILVKQIEFEEVGDSTNELPLFVLFLPLGNRESLNIQVAVLAGY